MGKSRRKKEVNEQNLCNFGVIADWKVPDFMGLTELFNQKQIEGGTYFF